MKKAKNLLAVLLAGVLLFSGCNTTTMDENETEETLQTEISTEIPESIPAKHEISIDEINSILVANGLRTNINRTPANPIYHGGHQMRVCHTERGTYVAFGKGDADRCFYVAKIAPDNTLSLLHSGEFDFDGSVPINIGQDINGDIIVNAATASALSVYIFDKDTDAVSEYSTPYTFGSVEYSYPGYAQTMFDFANRKVYMFYNGGLFTENYELEWFTFDLDTKTWLDGSVCQSLEGIGRHCYIFPFPDGNGGAYIVGERDILVETAGDQLQNAVKETYLKDEIKLFHIPDLSTGENITYTVVHEAYSERGHEGIWSAITDNQYGGVFMDADGYLHITYRFFLYNLSDQPIKLDDMLHFRHAIYDGMECIFNEKLDLPDANSGNRKPQIVQSADGTLFMLISHLAQNPLEIDIYKADDALGKTWHKETTITMPEGIPTRSFSISESRNGSVQDNTIGCFYYSYNSVNSGFAFNLSLDDYSVTEIVDLLAGYDLRIDEYPDNRSYNTAYQTKVIHTENAVYAAFVYDYASMEGKEYFHIVKMDNDGNVTVLHSDSYASDQDRYLTIQRMDDGMIYICPPTGNTIYTINPADDAVTLHKTTDKRVPVMFTPQQTELITDSASGTTYALSSLSPQYFGFSSQVLDTQTMTVDKASTKYVLDTDFIGDYAGFYTLNDNNGGVYLVGTRTITRDDLTDKLHYAGHIASINDAVTLFHIPVLAEASEVQTTDIFLPDETRGNEGIWSVADIGNCGDVYLDAGGKLHIFYTTYLFDFDDVDRPGNAALVAETLKHYHAVYDGTSLVSNEQVDIDGLTADSSVRVAETTDGTLYLLICNIGEAGAKIDVYFETEDGWALSQTKELGEFVAESFSISGSRGGSVQDNVIDCIIYGTDNDVYYTRVSFE